MEKLMPTVSHYVHDLYELHIIDWYNDLASVHMIGINYILQITYISPMFLFTLRQ